MCRLKKVSGLAESNIALLPKEQLSNVIKNEKKLPAFTCFPFLYQVNIFPEFTKQLQFYYPYVILFDHLLHPLPTPK